MSRRREFSMLQPTSLRGGPLFLRAALLAGLVLGAGAVGAEPTRYLAFGSSITEGIFWDDCDCPPDADPPVEGCPQACGYPRRLEERLRAEGIDAVVENHGLGGERTTEGLTRIDSVLDGGGDVLLLMQGTNDILRISRETTLFNLDEMARKARVRGISTVHATLIPRAPGTDRDPDNVLNERMAQAIRELASIEERPLADPFEVFSSIPNVFALFYGDELPEDVGHPNPEGYDLLADVFFNLLTGLDLIPPVLGPVSPYTDAEDLSPYTRIELQLLDFGSGVDLAATRLTVNGSEVSFAAEGTPAAYGIVHLPAAPLNNPVTVSVETRDLATPPNEATHEVTRFTVGDTMPEPCVPDETTLCIDHLPGDRRFEIKLTWRTALGGGLSGEATATPLAPLGFATGGLLSFFEGTPEVLIKVLDGCSLSEHFWVFGAATTTLSFNLTVVDTIARLRGANPESLYTYVVHNDDGEFAAPFFDTEALDTCAYNE
jgi:lysophospholipase L1-like esterase